MKKTMLWLLLFGAFSSVFANSTELCDNYTQGGMIWSQQDPAILPYCDNFGLLPLTEVAAPTGGSGGSPVYQWEFSLDGNAWQTVSVSPGQQRDLIPGSVLINFLLASGMDFGQSTWFRRGVRRTDCSNYILSNTVEFRVFHQVSDPGQFRDSWEYCNDQNGLNASYFHTGDPLSVQPEGGDQPYIFQWEFSIDQTSWSIYSGTELADLYVTPGTTGYYRRGVKPEGSPCPFVYSNTILITNVIPFELSLTLDHPNCSDEQTGRITVVDLSGNSQAILNSIAYSIDNGDTWQFSTVFDNLTAGLYTVQTQNKCSCPNGYSWCTVDAELVATPTPEIQDVDFIHPSDCGASDGSITIYGTGGVAPLEYSIDGLNFFTQTVFTGLAAGTYPISARNADGSCERVFGSITLNDPLQPELQNLTLSDPTECGSTDGAIQVLAGGGIQPFEFRLNNDPWTPNGFFQGLSAGTYQIGIRNADGTCQITAPATLISPSGPVITAVNVTHPSDCAVPNGSITVFATGGADILQYNIGAGWVNSPVFNNLPAGNYTVSVSNQSGACQTDYPIPIVLTGPSAPEINQVATSNPTDCGASDGMISIFAGGGTGNLEYNIGSGWSTSFEFPGLPSGIYPIQVRNSNGSCLVTYSGQVQLSDPPFPVINQVTFSNLTDCGANDGTITILASGPGPLEFNIGSGWVNTPFFSGLAPQSYFIQVRNPGGSCITAYPEIVVISEPEAPVIIDVNSSGPTDCNLSDGSITIQTEGPPGQVQYSIDGGNSWFPQPFFENLSPGFYEIAVQNPDQSCFVPFGSIELVGPEAPTIVGVDYTHPSDCGMEDGSIQISANNNAEGLEYRIHSSDLWSPNPAFFNLGPGVYQIQVRNNNGTCVTDHNDIITLTAPTTPSAFSVQYSDPTDCAASDGSIFIHPLAGSGNYLFNIGNGWTSNSDFYGLAAGDYNIQVSNNDGTCIVDHDQTISLIDPPMPVISNVQTVNPTDCNAHNGSISIEASGGTGAFQFNIGNVWTTNPTFSGLMHGNYTVQVRNSDGTCVVEYGSSISLSDPPLPVIAGVEAIDPSDCGANDGSISIAAIGGTGNLQFNIGSGWTSNSDFSGLTPGNYNVQIRNSDGTCVVEYSSSINLSDPPLPVIAGVEAVDPSDCGANDGSISIAAIGGTGSLQFNIGSGWTSNSDFSGLTPGNYNVQVRNSDGTCVVEYGSSISLSDPPLPAIAGVEAVDPSDCGANDGSISIAAIGGTGSLQFNIGSGWTANPDFSGLTPGNYTVQVRNSDGTCVVDYGSSISLSDPPLPVIAGLEAVDPSDCGANDGSISIAAIGGTGSLQFNIGSGWTSNSDFSGLTPGNYTVQVRNSDGTCVVDYGSSISLSDPPLPAIAGVEAVDPSDCGANDGSISIAAIGGTGSLQFNIGSGWTTNPDFFGLTPGNYTVQVRNSDGTCVVEYGSSISLSDPPLPVIAGVEAIDPSDCGANDGSISIAAIGGTGNLQFNIGSGWTTNPDFSGLTPGNYNVQIRNSDGTCVVDYGSSISLSDPPLPVIAGVEAVDPSDCGANDGSISIAAIGGTGSLQFNIGSGWTTNPDFSGLTPGNYNVQVRNSDGTCVVDYGSSISLSDPPLPVIAGVEAVDPSDCSANDGSISIAAIGGTGSLQFNIGSGWTSNSDFSGLTPGNYTVQIRNSDGTCVVDYGSSISLSDPPSPVIADVEAVDPSDCGVNDGSISIAAIGGTGSLQFNIGSGWASNPDFSGLTPGNYTVQIRNSDGTCVVDYGQSINLSDPPLPVIAGVEAVDPSDCGVNDGSISIAAIGGTGSLQFNIGSGWASNPDFSGLTPGNYTVQIRNSDGTCVVDYGQSINLSDPPLPVIAGVEAVDPSDCGANDGSISIAAIGGTGSLQFNIGSGWTSNSDFSGLTPGNYTVQVRNSDGTCVVEYGSSISLSDPPLPVIAGVEAIDPSDCGANDGSISIAAIGGTGSLQFNIGSGWTANPDFSGLTPGNYTVQIRNSDGTCVVEYGSSISLSDPPLPVIAGVEAVDPSDCGANDGSISIAAIGGTGSLQFHIGSGWVVNPDFFGLTPGNYTVQIRNSDGTCVVEYGSSISLSDPPLPVIAGVEAIDPSDCGANDGSIFIAAIGGTGSLQFHIGSGWVVNPDFSGLTPGNYNVQVRNSDGTCVVDYGSSINLSDPPLPVIAGVEAIDPSDCGANDGSISIAAIGGTGSLQFNIGSGWTSNPDFSGLTPGNYNVQIRNSDGTCVVEYGSSISLSDPPLPSIAGVEAVDPSDCGANDGSISIAAIGGTGSFQFTTSGGLVWSEDAYFMNLGPGSYQVGIRNSNGTCPVFQNENIQLISPESPEILNVVVIPVSDCGLEDGIIIITASGNGADEILYSLSDQETWQSSPVFTNLAPGSYYPLIANSNGTCLSFYDQSIELSGPEAPIITDVQSSHPTDCDSADGTIFILAQGGSGNYSYSPDPDVFPWSDSGHFSGLAPGLYHPAVRNADGTCFVQFQDPVLLSGPEAPVITDVQSSHPTDCDTADGTIFILAQGGSGNYSFSPDPDVFPWSDSGHFSGLAPGVYHPAVRNADGTCFVQFQDPVLLSGPEAPVIVDVQSSHPTDCNTADGTIFILAQGGSGNYSFSPDPDVFPWSDSGHFPGLAPGVYHPAVRNADGTCFVQFQDPVLLSGPEAPVIVDVQSSHPTDCNTADGTIFILAQGGSGNYSYSPDPDVFPWSDSGHFSGLAPGLYHPAVRNADGTCFVQFQDPVLLSGPEAPVITDVQSSHPTDCDTADGTIFILAQGGSGNYSFSPDPDVFPWSDSGHFSGLAPGVYHPAVRNADGTCFVQFQDPVLLSGPEAPVIVDVQSSHPTDCNTADGTLFILAQGGSGNYSFSPDPGIFPWSDSGHFSGLAPGVYHPAVRNADGTCFVQFQDPVLLSGPEAPVIVDVQSSHPTDCNTADGTIFILAQGGSGNYSFSPDPDVFPWSDSGHFPGLAPGVYHPAVRNADGTCFVQFQDPVLLSGPEAPVIVDVQSSHPTDCNTADGTIFILAQGGSGNYSFSPDPGIFPWSDSGHFSGLAPGLYHPAVRNADGTCFVQFQDPVLLSGPEAPVIVDVQSSHPTDCNTADGTIFILAQGGSGNYSFSPDPGIFPWSDSGHFSGLAPGVYHPAVRNADGTCFVQFQDPVLLSGPEAPVIVDVQSSHPTDCNTADGTIFILAQGGSGNYSFSPDPDVFPWSDSGHFSGLAPGVYHPAVRNADGTCFVQFQDPVLLSGPEAPVITNVQSFDPTDCLNQNGQIFISTSTSGDYEFSINGLTWQNTSIFTSLPPGEYTPMVRSINSNCTVQSSKIQLTGPPLPAIQTILNSPPEGCGLENGSIFIQPGGDQAGLEFSIDGGITWQNSPAFTNLGTGVYQPSIRNPVTNCMVISEETIGFSIQEPIQILDIQAVNPTDCDVDNGEISIEATGGGGLIYSVDAGQSWSDHSHFTGLPHGDYLVIVSNTDSTCISADQPSVHLTLPQAPQIHEVLSQGPTECGVENGFISIAASTVGNQLAYSIDNGLHFYPNPLFDSLPPGDYSIVVQSLESQCETAYLFPVMLTGPIQPLISEVETTQPTDCGTGDGAINITVSGGATIFETSIDGGINWQITAQYSHLAPGIYPIAIRNPDGTCRIDFPDTIRITPPFEVQVDSLIFIPPDSCTNSNGSCIIVGFDAANMEYSINGGVSWHQDSLISGLPAGPIQVSIRGSQYPGCRIEWNGFIGTSQIDLTDIFIRTEPVSDCLLANGIIEIQFHSGNTYQFSIDSGATWQTSGLFPMLDSGNYRIQVRDTANGCQTILDPVLTVLPAVAPQMPEISVFDALSCEGDNGAISISTAGRPFRYSIDNGQNWYLSGNFEHLGPGAFFLQIQDTLSHCQWLFPDTIRIAGVPPLQGYIAEQGQARCIGETDGYLIAGAIGGSPPYHYLWSEGSTSPELEDIGPGQYVLTVTDSRSCPDTLYAELETESDFSAITGLFRDTILCQGQSVEYDLGFLEGAEISWLDESGFEVFSPTAVLNLAGEYYVKIKDEAGCLFLDTFSIRYLSEALYADFLLPTEAVAGEPVVAIDITWPLADSIRWVYDRNEIQNLLSLPTQEFLLFRDTGIYSVFLETFYGACFERLEKRIRIVVSRDSLQNDPGSGIPGSILAFEIFPNPNDGRFSIKLVLDNPAPAAIWLFRESGQLVEHRLLEGSQTYLEVFERGDLRAGIYTVVVRSGVDWSFGHFVVY